MKIKQVFDKTVDFLQTPAVYAYEFNYDDFKTICEGKTVKKRKKYSSFEVHMTMNDHDKNKLQAILASI